VNFTNLLTDVANPNNAIDDNPAPFQGTDAVLINNNQVAGRCAGFHATGTEIRDFGADPMANDASMVGANPGENIGPTDNGESNCGSGLAAPAATARRWVRKRTAATSAWACSAR
jgi:hypothetical protein